jgi:peptidoglycan/LPS O-acetylase OafA/YrhL
MKGEIRSLTGLRGLAALLVVVAHFSVWMSVTPAAARPEWVGRLGGAGGIGMAIFFTLSGYVIALSYSDWDWRARPGFNLLRFFFYRFARLYPAFLLFAVVIVMGTPAFHDLADPRTWAYVVPHLLLWQSWWPVNFGGVNAAGGAFHVSWSISTECALYLMFGLGAILVKLLPPWRHKPAIVALVFFSTSAALLMLAGSGRSELAPDGWTDAEWRGWLFSISPYAAAILFGIGVAAHRISQMARLVAWATLASNLGALGLVVICGRVLANVPEDLFARTIAVALATGLLMIGARADSLANRLLSHRGIVYLGTISYSLYLFHFVAPRVFTGQFDTFDRTAGAFYAANFAVSLALAIMLATGIYMMVEVPGRRSVRAAADRLLGLQSARVAVAE